MRYTGCGRSVDSVLEALVRSVSKSCGTSLAGGSGISGPPIEMAVCFAFAVRFVVTTSVLGFCCVIFLCRTVVFEPLSPQIVTVSVKKSCFAPKRCRRGFPSKNSQLPLLSKTSNSLSTSIFHSFIFPCHTALDGTTFPSAMHNRFLDVFHLPILCFSRLTTDQHMAATIAAPSNTAETQTVFPSATIISRVCLNGTSIPILGVAAFCPFSCLCPTEYK